MTPKTSDILCEVRYETIELNIAVGDVAQAMNYAINHLDNENKENFANGMCKSAIESLDFIEKKAVELRSDIERWLSGEDLP